jgi:hypothetical protein
VAGLCGPDYAYAPTLGLWAPCPPTPVVAPGETLTTLLELPQSYPEFIATDGVNIYVPAADLGTIESVPVAGGAPVILATKQSDPMGIAVAGGIVYWANENGGTIMKVPVTGGTPVTVASGQGAPFEVAVDATNVYWTNVTAPAGVWSVPIAGGKPPTQLASTTAWGLTVRGGTVYYSDGKNVLSVPTAGGTPPTTIVPAQASPYALALGATQIFWSNEGGQGEVLSMPLAGGNATPTSIATGTANTRLATDGTNLYFAHPGTAGNDSSILRVPVGGGTPTALVTGQPTPETIVLDAQSVYWVDTYAGAIMKLTPK